MTFQEWFVRQFGALPLPPARREKLSFDAQQLRFRLSQLEEKLAADTRLQNVLRAARYAWNLTDKDKTEKGEDE